jgi:HEPN domain-containing protein
MGSGQKRSELQTRAQAKLDDAILLLQHGRYTNAYYIAGYAVELGLKACIAAQIDAETIPDKAF